ncbi:hypothetical protein TBLA_0A06800 [Henningerozyma blattae CBS 6284]|uniref:Trafficking protein particle complex II-specific subunit 120 n=1 Tax=Henningerozyma blattae (strain ATCC 34711 / CBS 6284 / DSM 70876 / NBRC 10599 / NRRL Y-10934 / UCD 77-7) TaxID=1071380 RepID=I2GWH0_HENB6|nr:hypothetical protein TBLA_0A06800 [Tetrapisispora blattae CBS 6284]CCH58472.1 hypothetical protein TBLA_0A06800 [Tetrapisispora blattae CBS 6284]
MDSSPLYSSSFVGPSRIKTIVVPIGNWKAPQFKQTLTKLQNYNEIRLLDITPIDSPLFNPQGFPNGRLYLDFLTSPTDVNNPLDLFLYDFEPFRKSFILIALVNDDSDPEKNIGQLKHKFPTVISHNLIYTTNDTNINKAELSTSSTNVFKGNLDLNGVSETILCDIGKNFLSALTHYYSSYKHVTLRSPGAIGGNAVLKTTLLRNPLSSTASSTPGMAIGSGNSLPNVTSKRISTFEMRTSNLKRSASLKLARSLTTSDNKVQQRSQGRQFKILGNFQLLAGRYIDALASFTEAVSLLHLVRDYIWLASALDGIGMCLLLLSYLDISFQLPQLILGLCPTTTSTTDNNSSNPNISTGEAVLLPRPSMTIQSPRNSLAMSSNLNVNIDNVNIPILIQSIIEKVLHYYELSLNHNTEYAPQEVYCSFLIKTLTYMTVGTTDSELSHELLKKVIKGLNQTSSPHNIDTMNANRSSSNTVEEEEAEEEADDDDNSDDNSSELSVEMKPRSPPLFSKQDVYCFASRLFEIQLKEMSCASQAQIYLPLAEIYGVLGFHRKRNFVLRLLLCILAAKPYELAWASDFSDLLIDMVKFFGIEDFQPEKSIADASTSSSMNFHKIALQLCLNIAERVNDDQLSSKLSTILINRYNNLLTKVEQMEILKKCLQPLIINESIKEYWDPFLLRSLSIYRLEFSSSLSATSSTTIPHKTEIYQKLDSLEEANEDKLTTKNDNLENTKRNVSSSQKVYNPFKRERAHSTVTAITPQLLDGEFLVGDRAEIAVSLQNPFKFEISITGIQVADDLLDYCEIDRTEISLKNPYYISPGSISKILLPIKLKKKTSDEIIIIEHLNISVFGLPSKLFKIVNAEKRNETDKSEVNERAKCSYFRLKILPEQPELEILKTTEMIDNTWMLLDGVKRKFHVTIRNKSLKSSIDYINISYNTNIEQNLKNDYWKNLLPDDLYEKEKQLEWLKTSLLSFKDIPNSLQPGEKDTVEIELDTKNVPLNFNEVNLIINYGSYTEDKKSVYMKSLIVPYKITVKRSIEVSNMEIIPINQPFAEEMEHIDWIGYFMKKIREKKDVRISDYVLLLIDLRNSWIDGIKCSMTYEDFQSDDYIIENNHTTRIIVPIRRIFYQENNFGNIAIPKVFQGRQFIRTFLNVEQVVDMREKFWCREYIMSRLSCHWQLSSNDDNYGIVNFKQFISKFDSRMVNTIYNGRLPFDIKIDIDENTVTMGDQVQIKVKTMPIKKSSTHDEIYYLNFIIFDNHTQKIIPRNTSRLLYNGVLSRTLTISKDYEGEAINTLLELIPIEKGEYEISVCISEGPNSENLLQFSSESVIFQVV